MNIRIAHASDLHYCPKHLEWVDRAFTSVVDAIADEDPGNRPACMVLSGDSFDHGVHVHDPAVHRFVHRVGQLADMLPVVVLQGTFSHDRPGCLNILREIRGKHPVFVADEICQVALCGGAWFRSEGYRFSPESVGMPDGVSQPTLVVSCLPSIDRGSVKAAEGQAASLVEEVCAGWAESNLAARALGIPTVLTTHGTVNGSVTESKFAMVSPDHEFSPGALFSAEASAVMVGHIHAHNTWEQHGRRIAYPGSITRLIHGHDQPTYWLDWRVGEDRSEFSCIQTPSRQLITLEFDGPPDMEQLNEAAKQCGDAYVRVRWSIDEEHRDSVDQTAIREIFTNAAEVKLEGRINPVQRVRAEGVSQRESLAEKLVMWGEVTETETDPLVSRLQDLQSMDPDAIVEKYINLEGAH